MGANNINNDAALSQASLNRLWARLLILSLYRQGVRDFCLAPGSRSTPLTLEVADLAQENTDVALHSHFDERGLGFLALGLAKTAQRSVAIIVTSGTAVANLLPAVVESGITLEKLILLTADRPQELIQCGANQAINQHNIFSSHVTQACYLPTPNKEISPNWLLAELSEALAKQNKLGGAIHINCPYAEPLYGGLEPSQSKMVTDYLATIQDYLDGKDPYLPFVSVKQCDFVALLQDWEKLNKQKGLILVGNIAASDKAPLIALSKELEWPVLCDPQAGFSDQYQGFDLWLQNQDCHKLLQKTDFILQFGARFVSKRLGQFLAQYKGSYWLVDKHKGRVDPYHLKALRIEASAKQLAAFFLEQSTLRLNPWAKDLKKASQKTQRLLSEFIQNHSLSELSIAENFVHWMAKDSALFIGNSLVIRLLDMASALPNCAVFANRGASGIDGLIATAVGVQRGIQAPMLCLLGDISALYDLNSLALLSHCTQPFVLIVVNNDGCGIFDLLPVPDERKQEFYRMSHGLDFAGAAKMFGLNYVALTSLDEAREHCLSAQRKPKATLIELKVSFNQAGQDLPQLFRAIRDAKLL